MTYPEITTDVEYKEYCLWAMIYKIRYYLYGDSLATDQLYDALERELGRYEKVNNIKYKYSPVDLVGNPEADREKVIKLFCRFMKWKRPWNYTIFEKYKW